MMQFKNYMLVVLLLVFASNAVDRIALGLVLQDIKVDLSLSDTQLGLLTGIAFALFYSIMGIPIARWADRGNRITIITLTTGLWSVAVALCGMAGSFVQLLMIRVAVAIGEAGCVPPAHSLIADYFPRAERPRAIAIYMLGAPLATVIGFFGAGLLNERYGWRMTFIILGLPGLALAALVWGTLKEPRRNGLGLDTIKHDEGPSVMETCATLWAKRSFRHLLIFFSMASLFANGVAQWKPSFFIRSFGLQTAELGAWLAVIYGVAGFLGTYLGGAWACRYAVGNERLQLKVAASAFCMVGLLSAFTYLSSNVYLAFALLGIALVASGMVIGPMFGTIHALVPERMRATAIAILYLFANLVGMGLGPLLAGILSDAFRPWAGDDSLRYALLALCPGYVWSGWHLWLASRTISRELALTEAAHDSSGLGDQLPLRPTIKPSSP
jgi:MFS family permease